MRDALLEFSKTFLKAECSTVGKKEYEGPLSDYFDSWEKDEYFGCRSFDEAESEMSRRNINFLLSKARYSYGDIDVICGGDLLNQCVATSFAASGTGIPYFGLYGACSTIAEAFICSALFIETGGAHNAVGFASSHFCSAERQYRFPLEYGSTRTPTAQNTVTGSGAYLFTSDRCGVRVKNALIGRIIDKEITDANNMGAAMAGAAADTVLRYRAASKDEMDSFDYIITGDLGREGHEIAAELLRRQGFTAGSRFVDCGMLIYDAEKQDVHSGGSGAGCMSSVLGAYFISRMRRGEIKRILAVGTGALLNPNSVLQKKTIPAVAHAVCFERED
ncbi:MAG: stage V sporulation protein AD [Clostridia bacterium]|nr:stage V sporulation protein AD [Clostridia bacterium]